MRSSDVHGRAGPGRRRGEWSGMRRRILVLVVAACSVSSPIAGRADASDALITGSAVTGSGACLTLVGFASDTANRSRWAGGYWEHVTTPGPVCSDTDPHFDPVVTCVRTTTIGERGSADSATVASITATGPGRTVWYFRIVDRPMGIDGFGAATGIAPAGPCGADAVATSPVVWGGFVITGR